MNRREFVWITSISLLAMPLLKLTSAQNLPDLQPFVFQTMRLLEALDFLGTPISASDKTLVETALSKNDETTIDAVKRVLDKYALFAVEINPESRVKVAQGASKPELWENGWRTFLVKVDNQAGITAELKAVSPQAKSVFAVRGDGFNGFPKEKPAPITKKEISDRWLDLSLYTKQPMKLPLSGLETEYYIIQLYSRDVGKRAARFSFNVGQATQDIGFRNETDILFNCLPSVPLTFRVLDEMGKPTVASFLIRDLQGNIYPSQAKRLAPDFYFQPQIYRFNGEQINLPAGKYTVEYGRGPEYLLQTKTVEIVGEKPLTFDGKLQRWINPAKFGWFSGDHHIHAAGCTHYETPTEGVNPADMMRHILGEGLNVGSVLTWGPGYDHQKQFFEGKDNRLSTAENLMRYDLEISGFPSSHAGHLVLLGLKDQNYPNAKSIEDWSTWTIPILRWAKNQGAITGYAHSGLGLETKSEQLPNYEMPRFDGIGANEYIVAVTQNLVDFISAVDTPPTWELNIWYHTLNAGYRTRIGGETDFPCMSDDKVGHGRSYVKVDGKLNFADWVSGLKKGRAYVSDGKSHIIDFTANGVEVGTNDSELKLEKPATVKITAKIAARLDEKPNGKFSKLIYDQSIWEQKPFWDLERARIGASREIPVELIVNGEPVATKNITADGSLQDISFNAEISKSSWIALRILPSSHTNPIFVTVGGKPVRASRRSAEWCLKAVDQCWSQKSPKIAAAEKVEAEKVYEAARIAYRKIIEESDEN
jgi:hypothetical protein